MSPERWRQIEDLFHAISEGEPSARESLLARADPEVRLKVEQLLDQKFAAASVGRPLSEALSGSPQPSIGSQIGPYRVESRLGSGGMGVVYCALDTRLGRRIALKVPNEPFDGRFAREARSIAALNHPNICTVHDVGPNYLVMELVEGPTLQDVLRKGAIPLTEAMSIALQIADALDAAHESGIVHRDLKPANVKIKPDGAVKVLDFGLARTARTPQPPTPDEPTHTLTVTEAGVRVGTPSYMAPEQALGKTVDKRADIWAFGAVVYEMLAGSRPFPGDTTADILRAVLTREPDWERIPAAARPLLMRCLQKDPRLRLRDIGDAPFRVEEPPPVREAVAPPRRSFSRVFIGLLGLAAGAAGGLWFRAGREPAASNVQFQQITDTVGMEKSPAISPDGKAVAFVAQTGDWRQIWMRLRAGGNPLQITHDGSDHEEPRWSPDSSSVVYFSPAATPEGQGTIWEIPALGGTAHRIGAAVTAGDLSHDGRWIAAFQQQGEGVAIVAIARDGSQTRPLRPNMSYAYDSPRWSPDDRWIAFHRAVTTYFDEMILVMSADGGEPRRVAGGHLLRGFSWLSDSSGLVYSSSAGSTILYPPIFNLRAVRRDGSGDRQLTFGDVSYVHPDVAGRGTVAASRIRIQSDVWRFPVDGTPAENTRRSVRVTRSTGQAQTPSASPDGREVVYLSDSGGHGNLWVTKVDGSAVRQITFEQDPSNALGVPIWSPVDNHIVFIFSRQGNTGEWIVNSDGSGLHALAREGSGADWGPDGHWLYYVRSEGSLNCLEKVPVEGGRAVRIRCEPHASAMVSSDGSTLFYYTILEAFTEIRRAYPETAPFQTILRIPNRRIPGDVNLWQATMSPDRRWLVMPLIDKGTSNLWLMSTDGGPLRRVTDFGSRSTLIQRRVSWSPDGKSIYAAVADLDADIVLLNHLVQ